MFILIGLKNGCSKINENVREVCFMNSSLFFSISNSEVHYFYCSVRDIIVVST